VLLREGGDPVASEPVAQHEHEPVGPPRHRAEHGIFDAWLIWSIAVLAILLPAIFLVCVSSIPAGRLNYADLHVAAGRGEFLVPVLIMCAEAIRRWTREINGGSAVMAFKITASVLCAFSGIICMTAAIISATTAATPMTDRSLIVITQACVIVGGIFGTAGVVARSGVTR